VRVPVVTSETFPVAKTGGLADVSAALPAALAELGVDIRLLMSPFGSHLSMSTREWGNGLHHSPSIASSRVGQRRQSNSTAARL